MHSFRDPFTQLFENGWGVFLDLKDITVFIVDDDDSVRRSLKRLITVAGIKTMLFGSAQEFISSAHYLSSGVLLLDVRMPKMSGLELQKHLTDIGSEMPIIFITAYEDIRARQTALEAGAMDFLLKPFDDQTLLNTIQRAIGSHSSSKE